MTAAFLLAANSGFADCTNPDSTEGSVIYNTTYHVVQFCNGANWVNAGSSGAISVGTLTSGDFCTTDGTTINCTTSAISLTSQVSGTLQAAQFPALTGDVTTSAGSLATTIGAGKVTNAMLAGSIAASKLVGTDIATVGTITAGTWHGTAINLASYVSGNLPVANLGGGTGASSSTFWRGDGTWATAGASPGGSSWQVQYNSGGSALGGAAALVYATSGALLTATAQAATDTPVVVKAAASQSGDLMQVQDSGGSPLTSVDSAGKVLAPKIRLAPVAGGEGSGSGLGEVGGNNGELQYNASGSWGGATALVYASSGTNLQVKSQNATDIPLAVRAASSQSANLLELQDSGGSPLVTVSSAGVIGGSGASLTALNASNLSSGTVATARLGSGTENNSTYLRGDGTWASESDPKVGTLTNGKWCTTDGAYVNCTTNAPSSGLTSCRVCLYTYNWGWVCTNYSNGGTLQQYYNSGIPGAAQGIAIQCQ